MINLNSRVRSKVLLSHVPEENRVGTVVNITQGNVYRLNPGLIEKWEKLFDEKVDTTQNYWVMFHPPVKIHPDYELTFNVMSFPSNDLEQVK